LYVLFVHAWYIESSLQSNLRSWIHLSRCILFATSIVGYQVNVRLGILDALRLLQKANFSRCLYE
jgi:hypothetical protein